jgi:hypothetical protein
LRTAVTATVVLKIQKNDKDIGTITFTSGANILTQGGQGGVVAITAETTFIPAIIYRSSNPRPLMRRPLI